MTGSVLCTLGHIATSHQLAEQGLTPARLRGAIERGELSRLRRGIYGCCHIDTVTASATIAGGAITCVSVLREAGVWAGHSTRLHVQIPPNARIPSNARGAPPIGASPSIRYHWERPQFGMLTPWRVTPVQALWQAIHCLDEENAIAAMESTMHEGFLPRREVMRLAQLAPRRLRDSIRRIVFTSGSGIETITRLRLERAGFRVESQSHVPGMGHEDLVVEECVGIDVDGRQWHGEDRFAIDRDRDIHVEGFGRRALRPRASHIFSTWPHTLAVIERAVSDAQREKTRRRGRVLVAFDDPL